MAFGTRLNLSWKGGGIDLTRVWLEAGLWVFSPQELCPRLGVREWKKESKVRTLQ